MQYLAQQMGGVSPDAASRLLFAGARQEQANGLGMGQLSNEQQYQGGRQGLHPIDMANVLWKDGRWKNSTTGQDHTGRGDTFNYGVLPHAPAGAGKMMIKEVGGEAGMGEPPPVGTNPPAPPAPPTTGTGRVPVPGAAPPPGMGAPSYRPGDPAPPPATVPATRTPPPGSQVPPPPGLSAPSATQPPRNPVTTPPVPPTPGPATGGPPAYQPGPLSSFNPTQMLLALRQATSYGQQRGANPVQANLAPYMAAAMQSRGG